MRTAAFFAMLARDAHVARRNIVPLLLQVMLQPLLLVFVFGRVLTASGMMQQSYKGLMLPGIMGLGMVLTGIQAVAMPLIAEFQFTREIEDRLLAPIAIEWIAVEKIVAGMLQALVAGAVVFGSAWLALGADVGIDLSRPGFLVAVVVLVSIFSAAAGLTLGSSVGQTHIGLMFSLVLAPMIMFGCVYYPWSALASFPIVQKLVLVNPLVYACEGLRGALAPRYPHMDPGVVIGLLTVCDVALIWAGLNRFRAKAVS
jgi:ABC-2 type transport system permease protein